MKKFSFRLQRLLDLASRQEEVARRLAAQALNSLQQAEAKERQAHEIIAATEASLGICYSKERVSPADIEALFGCLRRQQNQLTQLSYETQIARTASDQAQDAMIEQRRQFMAYESTRERAWEQWRAEALREENEAMEETAATRYTTKIRNEVK